MVGLIAIGDLLPAVLASAMEHARGYERGPGDGDDDESGASHDAASSEEVEAALLGDGAASRALNLGEEARERIGTNRRAQMNAPSLRRGGTGRGVMPLPADSQS